MLKVKGHFLKPFSEGEKDFADVMTGLEDLAEYRPASPREVEFLADCNSRCILHGMATPFDRLYHLGPLEGLLER